MTLTVEAVYENGVLKPTEPLPLREHEEVSLTVEAVREPTAPPVEEAVNAVRRSYGLIGWTGGHEALERILAELEEPEELP